MTLRVLCDGRGWVLLFATVPDCNGLDSTGRDRQLTLPGKKGVKCPSSCSLSKNKIRDITDLIFFSMRKKCFSVFFGLYNCLKRKSSIFFLSKSWERSVLHPWLIWMKTPRSLASCYCMEKKKWFGQDGRKSLVWFETPLLTVDSAWEMEDNFLVTWNDWKERD